jgi:hypothetical protein
MAWSVPGRAIGTEGWLQEGLGAVAGTAGGRAHAGPLGCRSRGCEVGGWCSSARVGLSEHGLTINQQQPLYGPGHSSSTAHDGGALWSAAWQAERDTLLACVAAGTEQLHHRGALRACCRSRGATRNGTATVAKQRSTRRALWPGRLPGQPSGGRAMIIHGRAGGRSLGVRADVHGWL